MLPAEPLSWTGNISAAKTGCFRSNYRLRQRDNKPTWTLEHEHPCLLASASCLHTLCHSRIMHSRLLLLPPSVLRSVQHSPPSTDCCCLPTAVEIKGGGMEEHKIFSKSSNYCCTAVVKTESAPPATPWQVFHSAWTALLYYCAQQHCQVLLLDYDRFWIQILSGTQTCSSS